MHLPKLLHKSVLVINSLFQSKNLCPPKKILRCEVQVCPKKLLKSWTSLFMLKLTFDLHVRNHLVAKTTITECFKEKRSKMLLL